MKTFNTTRGRVQIESRRYNEFGTKVVLILDGERMRLSQNLSPELMAELADDQFYIKEMALTDEAMASGWIAHVKDNVWRLLDNRLKRCEGCGCLSDDVYRGICAECDRKVRDLQVCDGCGTYIDSTHTLCPRCRQL